MWMEVSSYPIRVLLLYLPVAFRGLKDKGCGLNILPPSVHLPPDLQQLLQKCLMLQL